MTTALHDLSATAGDSLPHGTDAWLERARDVADALRPDAVGRDEPGREPHEEVRLLKVSGLPALLAPLHCGGGGKTSRPRSRWSARSPRLTARWPS